LTADIPTDDPLLAGPSIDERAQRLLDGADRLGARSRRVALRRQDRVLLTTSGALMSLGVLAIVLGWAGASRSTHTEEQMPYLISGGLLGVALATIGSVTFFAFWLSTSMRQAQEHEAARHRDHEQLVEVLMMSEPRSLPKVEGRNTASARAGSQKPERPLRRVARGS